MNSINVLGRLGQEPEMKYTDSGLAICRLRVAVDRGRKGDDGEKLTDWFTCKAFGKTAEVAGEHLTTGRTVGLTGSMQNEQWTDREGKTRDNWVMMVDRLTFVGDRDKAGGERTPPAQHGQAAGKPAPAKASVGTGNRAPEALEDEEIPF